jgi:hypothetical protein
MEDLPDVYERPLDTKSPLVTQNEASKQLFGQSLKLLPKHEVLAREEARNAAAMAVNCRFTTVDARTKLLELYPSSHLGGLLDKAAGGNKQP